MQDELQAVFLAEGDGRWMLERRQRADGSSGVGVRWWVTTGGGGAATVDYSRRVCPFSPLVGVTDLKEEGGVKEASTPVAAVTFPVDRVGRDLETFRPGNGKDRSDSQ